MNLGVTHQAMGNQTSPKPGSDWRRCWRKTGSRSQMSENPDTLSAQAYNRGAPGDPAIRASGITTLFHSIAFSNEPSRRYLGL